jgi:hypothetical protein
MAGVIVPFRGCLSAPDVYNEALIRMASLYKRIETDRGVLIPDAIRLFLSHTVIESLYLHHDAWLQHRGLDPKSNAASGAIGEVIENSLAEVLTNAEAEPWTPNGTPQMTLIGVLTYIHSNWCRIFPLCR